MKEAGHTTKKIRTVIVDDEILARTNLTVLLRMHSEIEIVAECGSGREALSVVRASKADLVFLDVQIPECDGFDVVEMLGGDAPYVIFVTAYDRYALRAFEVGALDYLLKPFDNVRFGSYGSGTYHLELGRSLENRLNAKCSQNRPRSSDGNPDFAEFTARV